MTFTNCMLCGRRVPPYEDETGIVMCRLCKDAHENAISFREPIPEGIICRNCKEHPGTEYWCKGDPNRGALTFAWCRCCVIRTQITYAQEQADKLPGLKAELASACRKER